MDVLRAIGNVLWLILVGWWLAIAYAVAGALMFITIIGIPFGVQAFKLAGYALWPFGRTAVDRRDADGAVSAFGNVVWIVLGGWWLAVLHVVAALALTITLIGIPFAIQLFKMARLAIWPIGMEVVPIEEADRRVYASSPVATAA